jgi:agmatine deiminase
VNRAKSGSAGKTAGRNKSASSAKSTAKIAAAEADQDAAIRRWPAEWEPQSTVWFAWPHNRETWPKHYKSIPSGFSKMVQTASEFVPVRVLAAHHLAAEARRRLGQSSRIELIDIATNDCWIRDYGPTFVQQGGEIIGIDWKFNAWGGKYPPWDDDAAAAKLICQAAGVRRERSSLGLEGGAIEGDGGGRLLTTPSCVQTATRNRGWGRDRIAAELHKRLGVTEIVWIDGGGLEGDDTDGHIDQLARFVDAQNVVAAVCDDPNDPNQVGLERNYKQLMAWSEQTSPKVSVHRLPIPPARKIAGARVPESYCNFLMLGEQAVLIPTFGDARSDDRALSLMRELLPAAEVIGVNARDFAWGLGAWHCASQQQPA